MHRAMTSSAPSETLDSLADLDPITVVLSDDHQVIRAGLRLLLESEEALAVVGEAGDVATTLTQVADRQPRVLVLDLNLGGESGLDLIPVLRTNHPGTQIVVLTMQEDPIFARAALSAGASGYVLKDAIGAELTDAIVAVAAGRSYLNPQLGARLAALSDDSDRESDPLTAREREVMRLIGLGHTNPGIAASLSISVRTVESHRAHIQQKTGLTSRADLVAYAHEHNLLD
jgi:two-component system response regulator NreC